MSRPLNYPPPWQDTATLCSHLCISPTTVDVWVKQGFLPSPKNIGGKRLWKWSEVEKRLEGRDADGAPSPDGLAERIRNATRTAAQGHEDCVGNVRVRD